MAEHKERTVQATAHQRPHSVTFSIRRGQPPHVRFREEEVIIDSSDSSITYRDIGSCETDLNISDGSIALRNYTTGTLTGQTVTHAQLLSAIYSLYRELAVSRDGN